MTRTKRLQRYKTTNVWITSQRPRDPIDGSDGLTRRLPKHTFLHTVLETIHMLHLTHAHHGYMFYNILLF